MAKNHDWMPGARAGILAMANAWIAQLIANGETWGIPATAQAQVKLKTLTLAAEGLYASVQSAGRTPANLAKCRAAFAELESYMRFVKYSYFKSHVLRPEDYPNLQLKPPDRIRTPVLVPAGVASSKVELSVPRRLTVFNQMPAASEEGDRSNYGFRIYMSVEADDPAAQTALTGKHYYLAKPPASPEELHESDFTRKRRHRFDFAYEDAGKTAHFCVRIENEKGDKGPWGTMFSAVIP